MDRDVAKALVRDIMLDFARITGLEPVSSHPKRYLWTDAFAVCNYLELFRMTKDAAYRDLALRLVDQVHHTLGRHRDDDPRRGWISGFSEPDGEQHPTIGGLRIGKQMNERKAEDPYNEGLEWDQDGQYFHYLTKWMHALCRVSRVTGNPTYIRWAIELAKTAYSRFTYAPSSGGRKRMYWKMSIDLTYPLVPSMGQHDPLDGFVTYSELHATAVKEFDGSIFPSLKGEISDMAEICRGMSLATDDPLGIGGLLDDSSRIAQLMIRYGLGYGSLLEAIISSALPGIKAFTRSGSLGYPAEYRLAFRELGLSIGISAAEDLQKLIEKNQSLFQEEACLDGLVGELVKCMPLKEMIEQFWIDSKNRESSTWTEHREINMVMLATSVAPNEFLMI